MVLRKGQMIIEVVIAFTITVIALVALLQLSRRSVGFAGGSGRISAATAYANAAIDWMTNEKVVNGWAGLREKCVPGELGFVCGPTVYSFGDLSWSSSGTNISGTEFDRSVTLSINAATPNILRALVSVSWTEGARSPLVTRVFEFVEQ